MQCGPIYRQWIETFSDCGPGIVVERSEMMVILIQIIADQNSKNQHNSVLRAFSVPNWSEMCGVVDVLTVVLLSPTQ